MYSDNEFIYDDMLPRRLSNQEVYELFEKMKLGDESARTKLIEHNIRLVLYEVDRRFSNVQYDKKDLVSIGIIGLIKAVSNFDVSKGVEFSTYAARCIHNEILKFLRTIKSDKNILSLDMEIYHDKAGKSLKIEDVLSDGTDILEKLSDNEIYLIIRQLLNELQGRDREFVMLYFGFYDGKIHTQQEIADMFHVSKAYVNRTIMQTVKRLKEKLEQKGFIELIPEEHKKTRLKAKKRVN